MLFARDPGEPWGREDSMHLVGDGCPAEMLVILYVTYMWSIAGAIVSSSTLLVHGTVVSGVGNGVCLRDFMIKRNVVYTYILSAESKRNASYRQL